MRLVICIISCVLLFGCQQKQEKAQPQQVLHDKVLDIHDEAMILMSPIYSKIKKIRYLKDSTALDIDPKAEVLISDLVQSEEAMMDWMAEWKTPKLDSVSEHTMTYLRSEEKKIINIKAMMNQSILRADSFINFTETQI